MHTDQFGIEELKTQLRASIEKRIENAKYWREIHQSQYDQERGDKDWGMIVAWNAAITELEWMLREIEFA